MAKFLVDPLLLCKAWRGLVSPPVFCSTEEEANRLRDEWCDGHDENSVDVFALADLVEVARG